MSSLKRKYAPKKATAGPVMFYKKPRISAPSSSNSVYRPSNKKRTHNKRSVYVISTKPLFNRGPGFMPNSFSTRMVYVHRLVDLTVAAVTTCISYFYRGNSIYDPLFAVGGTTAMGHAEMAAIYNEYNVVSSRIIVNGYCSNIVKKPKLYIFPTRNTTAITSELEAAHHPNSANVDLADVTSPATIKGFCRTNILYSVKDLDELGFRSFMTGNPSNEWYWCICLVGEPAEVLQATVTIEYFVNLFSPKRTSPSSL